MLLVPYRQQAEQRHPRSKKAFRKLVTVHVVLWTLYPVVWMLAGTGFGVLNQTGETFGYTVLDLASKVGFGFLSLNTLKQIEQAGESQLAREYESMPSL